MEKLENIQKKEIDFGSNDRQILKKMLDNLESILQLMRIYQWPKNLFVFSGILISFNIFDLKKLINSIFAFLLFCGISSAVYIINDIVDVERDKLHPVKRMRPLPAGKIKKSSALVFEALLLTGTLLLSFLLNMRFGGIVTTYFILNLLYSFKLKEFVLIDVIIISIGFVLRAISGTLVTEVKNSFWLLLSIAFLTLFLGFNKRKREIIRLVQKGEKHRKNLNDYSVDLINEIIPMLTSCAIISYSFYVVYEVAYKFMIITIPIVLYAILRYQYLTNMKNYGENPELVFRDKPTIYAILIWCLIFVSSKVMIGTWFFK